MTSAAFHLKTTILAILCLALLTACFTHRTSPRAVFPSSMPPIHKIALLPIIFNDDPIDHFVELRTSEEILWQSRRLLENKGYLVIPEEKPSLSNIIPPFALELTSPTALAAMAPETTDAILLIRIDHFLDAGIYGGHDSDSNDSLDIYATAQLVLRGEKRIVWQRQGFGTSGTSGWYGSHEINASRDLVDNLFATLPSFAAE